MDKTCKELFTQDQQKFWVDFQSVFSVMYLNEDSTNMSNDESCKDEVKKKSLVIQLIMLTIISHVNGKRIAMRNLINSYTEWRNAQIECFKKLCVIIKLMLLDIYCLEKWPFKVKICGLVTCLTGGLLFIWPKTSFICCEIVLIVIILLMYIVILNARRRLQDKVRKAQKIIKEDMVYFQDMYDLLEHEAKLKEALCEFLKIDIIEKIFENIKCFVEKGMKIENDERLFFIEKELNSITLDLTQAMPKSAIATILSSTVMIVLSMLNRDNQSVFDFASHSYYKSTTFSFDAIAIQDTNLHEADDRPVSIYITETTREKLFVKSLQGEPIAEELNKFDNELKQLNKEAQIFQYLYENISILKLI